MENLNIISVCYVYYDNCVIYTYIMLKRKLDICDSVEKLKQQKKCRIEFTEIDWRPICDEYVKHYYMSIYKNGVQYDEIIDMIKNDIVFIMESVNVKHKTYQEILNTYIDNKFDLVDTVIELII